MNGFGRVRPWLGLVGGLFAPPLLVLFGTGANRIRLWEWYLVAGKDDARSSIDGLDELGVQLPLGRGTRGGAAVQRLLVTGDRVELDYFAWLRERPEDGPLQNFRGAWEDQFGDLYPLSESFSAVVPPMGVESSELKDILATIEFAHENFWDPGSDGSGGLVEMVVDADTHYSVVIRVLYELSAVNVETTLAAVVDSSTGRLAYFPIELGAGCGPPPQMAMATKPGEDVCSQGVIGIRPDRLEIAFTPAGVCSPARTLGCDNELGLAQGGCVQIPASPGDSGRLASVIAGAPFLVCPRVVVGAAPDALWSRVVEVVSELPDDLEVTPAVIQP